MPPVWLPKTDFVNHPVVLAGEPAFHVYAPHKPGNLSRMRLIGYVPGESAARTLASYLYVQGIENHLELQNPDGWGVWVKDEDKLQRATDLLAAFLQNPADPKYSAEAKAAERLQAAEEKDQEAYRKRLRGRRHLFRPLSGYGFGPLTFVLIVASVVVFILTKFGTEPERLMSLFITAYTESGKYIIWDSGLTEIRHGQVWRLFTPILLHFSAVHIIFNMWWLKDLGSMIEGRQSSWHLAALVLVIAAVSNVAEFYLGHTPSFGGMSGVVYGLLGYVWIRGKFDPASGLFLHPSTVTMMLIWLVACFTPLMVWLIGAQVANIVHVAGLLVGVAWGYLSSLRHR